ncbi:MAG: hypothetical protein OXU20_37735 [Myxococcales bacterium]|nr:hypothetical protein [Myxococcales bacterium]MDD9967305.1 hypothetical protein [Myxococcales bacterium]
MAREPIPQEGPAAPTRDPQTELANLGTRDIAHLGTSLHEHLVNTYGLLQDFGNQETLCLAGLYHAAYSTDGFSEALFDPKDRTLLADLIGAEAETIVYHYCASDREYAHRLATTGQPCAFRDRFTGTRLTLLQSMACHLWELTLANELEIAIRNQAFRDRNRAELTELFQATEPFLSRAALQRFHWVFC